MNDPDPFNLQRFIDAQDQSLDRVLAELQAGAKTSHWMWFVFPQLRDLGRSSTAQYYGIASIDEAQAYLAHRLLGPRLRQCLEALLPWAGERTPEQILGPIDALKLKSCLTLFEAASGAELYGGALDLFYAGERDQQTLALLNRRR
ncbi:MAG TPA: DUF1810 domain-containing protein [Sphingomicrobium sp.]